MPANLCPTATTKSPRIEVLKLENFDVPGCHIEMSDIDYRALLGNCIQGKGTSTNRARVPFVGRTSKYKGVSRVSYKRRGKNYLYWNTSICPGKKNVRIGQFPFTPEGEKDAARAYDKAALKLWGDDALTNQQYYGDLE